MSDDRNRKPPLDDDRRIAAEAARWHVTMADDAEVARNLESFSAWLDADARHLAAFTRLCTTHPGPTHSPARSALAGLLRLFRPRPVRWAIPALAIALVVTAALWSPPPGLEVPAGPWQEQIAEDGSMLRFGPGSRANIAFSREQRLVKLAAGSVIVEAAKDANRPLIVETPHGAVRVVGTRFTVIVDSSSTELSVSHGEVQATAATNGAPLSVRPGQRVHISRQAVTRDPVATPDAEEAYGGWRTLNRAPVTDLVAAVERETGRRIIVLPTPTTQAAQASGRFRVRDAEATLSLLVEAHGLRRIDAPFGVVILH